MNVKDVKLLLYQVGGSVRDEIMGHQPNDIDYAVKANSFNDLKEHLRLNNFDIFVEKEEYGTIKARCPITKKVSDYTLCRTDGPYSDNRRPDFVGIGTIEQDLNRRDFTMNAIAKILDKDESYFYLDPHNGAKDIEQKIIRCVRDAKETLFEDPLRGLRALRFSITKNMRIDPPILSTMKTLKFKSLFKELSKERVQQELQKMFKHDTVRSLQLLSQFDESFLNLVFNQKCIKLIPTLKKIK